MSSPATRVESFRPPISIGVLADTHVFPESRRELPREVLDLFLRARVGLILHCGDINDRGVLDQLADLAPVIAVLGNTDSPDLAEELPLKVELAIGKYGVGMLHGHVGGKTARQAALNAFPSSTHFVFYGHSHIPSIEKQGETVYFNPGSPTDRRQGPHFGVGILRVSEDQIDPNLILFKRPADLGNVTVPEPTD